MRFRDFKKQLLKDPKFKKEHEKQLLPFEIAKMLIGARLQKGLSQADLAKLAKTKQSSIARLENGSGLPSLSFLKRIADAYGTRLIPPKFAFMENVELSVSAAQDAIVNNVWPSRNMDMPIIWQHPQFVSTAQSYTNTNKVVEHIYSKV